MSTILSESAEKLRPGYGVVQSDSYWHEDLHRTSGEENTIWARAQTGQRLITLFKDEN